MPPNDTALCRSVGRRVQTFLLIYVIFVGAWAIAGNAAVPRVVNAVYGAPANSLLSKLLPGKSEHSPEHYVRSLQMSSYHGLAVLFAALLLGLDHYYRRESNRPVPGYLFDIGSIGLLAGLYSLTLHHAATSVCGWDEAVYLQLSRSIAETGFPVAQWGEGEFFQDSPPVVLYSLALARLGGHCNTLYSIRLFYATLWVLPAFLSSWYFAKRMLGSAAALATLLIWFTQSWFPSYGAHIQLDTPLASLAASLFASIAALQNSKPLGSKVFACAAWGFLCFLSCLTKFQGVLLPAFALIYLAIAWKTRLLPRKQIWVLVAITFAAGILAAVAWILLGQAGGYDLIGGFIKKLTRVKGTSSEPWLRVPLFTYWLQFLDLLGYFAVATACLALILQRSRLISDARLYPPILWVCIVVAFCSLIQLRQNRYFTSASPAVMILAGSIVNASYNSSNLWRHAYVRVLVACGIILAGISLILGAALNIKSSVGRPADSDYAIPIAGFLEASSPPNSRIITSLPSIAYEANRRYYISFTIENAEEFMRLSNEPNLQVSAVVGIEAPLFWYPDMSQEERERCIEELSRTYEPSHLRGIPYTVYLKVPHRRTSLKEAP
jgi:4-amino-4-deoxy-L-arabinose transferase-like glycosyltransferase